VGPACFSRRSAGDFRSVGASETALFSLVRRNDARGAFPGRCAQRESVAAAALESLIIIIGLNETCNVFAACLSHLVPAFRLRFRGAAGPRYRSNFVLILLIADITPKTFAQAQSDGNRATYPRARGGLDPQFSIRSPGSSPGRRKRRCLNRSPKPSSRHCSCGRNPGPGRGGRARDDSSGFDLGGAARG